ncbi:serine hydrolase domain-containing protein [Raineya orbicola]|jgi:CubicO group peptidase (beta-lactamase class C family)|uniref:Beta-lactamase n=1 Tax=Raineya orbicola TaxID=2016530 RepID=A0A2N3IK20_9BACT|nr:serine hydrolase domain-containing protein [Raineya orbicola]PKQ70669.1 Beta-lactamase [Raineya orbicola]
MRKILLLLLIFLVGFSCKKKDTKPAIPTDLYFPPLQSTTWEQIKPEDLGWNTAKIADLENILQQNGTRAFIVLKNGRIVIEKYYNNDLFGQPFTQNSIWYWASAGKSLTATIVGKAQEENFLNINQKTSDFLGTGWTSLTPAQESQITIRHQLTMTTGLDDAVSNPDCTTPNCLTFKASAGSRWAYHNAPYTLLSKVVENATGQTYNNYFASRIRDKIGMDGSWNSQNFNNVYYSTARSMARFGILISAKGKWQNETILNDTNYLEAMINTSQNLNQSYGYLWWLNGKNSFMIPQSQLVFSGTICPYAPADMYAAVGKNGQILNIVPSQNLIVVRMGMGGSTTSLVAFDIQNQIWEKLSEVIR